MAEAATPNPVQEAAKAIAGVVPAKPEAQAAETPKVESKPEIKPEDSQRFAVLARKEKAIVEKQQALKAEMEVLAKHRAELDGYRSERENAKRNPDSLLRSIYGENWYETLTEYKLNSGKLTPELVAAAVDDKLSKFQAEQAEKEKQRAEQERQRLEEQKREQLEHVQAEISDFIQSHAEEYELISQSHAQHLVLQRMQEEWTKNGKTLSHKEAADAVEKQIFDEVQKLLKLKKFATKAEPPAQGDQKQLTTNAKQRTTLTNDMVATTPTPKPARRSEAERLRAAMAALDRA